jgi:hypothetical protein
MVHVDAARLRERAAHERVVGAAHPLGLEVRTYVRT